MFTWKDGKRYVGEFRDTKMHGKGKIIYPNKQVVEGIWEDDHNIRMDAVHNNVSNVESRMQNRPESNIAQRR